MTDASEKFRELREVASRAYSDAASTLDASTLERRVARNRAARGLQVAALSTAAAAALGIVVAFGPWIPSATPAHLAPHTPQPSVSTTNSDAWPAWCASAMSVEGKAYGDLAGLQGWYNGTPDAPCKDWDERIKQHPDTVQINTTDNTMVEAYYRTSRDALGVYAHLGDGFVVPHPDPTWPAASWVLIDAGTGEVLMADLLSNYVGDAGAHESYPSPSPNGSLESSG